MTIDIKQLQAVADSLAPGRVMITVVTTSEPIIDPDPRRAHQGENRLAVVINCKPCNKTGEVLDADKLPDVCHTCDGKGYTMGADPTMKVDTIIVNLGLNVTVSIATLDGSGRIDRRRVRTMDELKAAVMLAVGQIALEVAKPIGGLDMLEQEAHALLDLAAAAGAITSDVALTHKAARSAHRLKREAADAAERANAKRAEMEQVERNQRAREKAAQDAKDLEAARAAQEQDAKDKAKLAADELERAMKSAAAQNAADKVEKDRLAMAAEIQEKQISERIKKAVAEALAEEAKKLGAASAKETVTISKADVGDVTKVIGERP